MSEMSDAPFDIQSFDQHNAEIVRLTNENARLRAALVKIRDDHYPPSDLEIRDCEQPEMIWQSIARRALAPVMGSERA